jgi:hypothetical protein
MINGDRRKWREKRRGKCGLTHALYMNDSLNRQDAKIWRIEAFLGVLAVNQSFFAV